MNLLESQWLGKRLALLPEEAIFPLLNIGSSTLTFRTLTQSYIDENIFAPLRARRGKIYHLDMKSALGVDIVGDLTDPRFLEKIANLKVQSVILSNVLEHVANRREICDVVMKILPPGGYLFVTGPHNYPYHPDPIDTMFRPDIDEVSALFPGTELIESAIIDSGNWRQWKVAERGRPLGRFLLRLLFPFYHPLKWWEVARQAPYLFFHISAFAVILRKYAN